MLVLLRSQTLKKKYFLNYVTLIKGTASFKANATFLKNAFSYHGKILPPFTSHLPFYHPSA